MEKLKMQTKDLSQENFKKLKEIFPEVVTKILNDKGDLVEVIDKDKLLQEISVGVIDGNEERYQLTWPDKRNAVLAANAPISKTLRPCREESINFDETENLYIEGDNLEVLKLLQETYLGKIKMIYIDPPYNTGRNLIYQNDFHNTTAEYLEKSGQYDDQGNNLVNNFETNGRFHTDWLNMMYPRLKLAKNLLSEDGILACAIDENEFATLSMILKEIFGESSYNHSYVTVVHNPRGQQGKNFSYVNEYLIFVYPSDGNKYLSDFPKDEVDDRNLRDSGTDSDRKNARNCFYPFLVKNNEIIGIGEVAGSDVHPISSNVDRGDGIIEVWPLNDSGEEKKWRYARDSVENIISDLSVRPGRSSLQIIFSKSEGTLRSVWSGARYDASEYGTKLVQNLIGDSSFTYPKSLYNVYDALLAGVKNDKNAIVLDFFSGSATTAHALMKLNLKDKGKRKFIMVQIPEIIDSDSKAYQSGYRTICDIGKKRIHVAGTSLIKNNSAENNEYILDTGFRVLKTDTSNMKDVFYTPFKTEQSSLDLFSDNIKEDRTSEDLLFQVMLDLGVPFSSTIERDEINGIIIYIVNQGYLVACFDNNVNDQTIKKIAEKTPDYAVFRDSSMSDDSVVTNFNQIFDRVSPRTIRKVI